MNRIPGYKWLYFILDVFVINLSFFISLKIYSQSAIDIFNSDIYILHPYYWFYLPYSIFILLFARMLKLYNMQVMQTFITQTIKIILLLFYFQVVLF